MLSIYWKPTIIHDNFFHDLSEIDWFAATNFRDQTLSTPIFIIQLYGEYLFMERNIRDNEALVNLAHEKKLVYSISMRFVWYTL